HFPALLLPLVRIHLAYREPLRIKVFNFFPFDYTLIFMILGGVSTLWLEVMLYNLQSLYR
ncbi:hypothetical protein GE061_018367, partial [Apolygus lucorum]